MTVSEIDFLDGLEPRAPRVGPGRQAKPLQVSFDRELTEADLQMPAVKTQTAPSIKRIRDTHHALARVLSTGVSEAEASLVTGYSLSRISILKGDPQFEALLEFYREKGTDQVADMRARMVNLGLDAVSELADRLEEKPEEFNVTQLRELARDMADRTGFAPQRGPSSVTQINVGLSDRMQKARERVAAAMEQVRPAVPVRVIDHD